MVVSQNLASLPTSSFFFCYPSINNGLGFCFRIHHPELSHQGKLCSFNTVLAMMVMKRRSRFGLKKKAEMRRAVRMNGTAHEDNASSPVSTAEAAVELGLSLFRKGRVCMYLCTRPCFSYSVLLHSMSTMDSLALSYLLEAWFGVSIWNMHNPLYEYTL